MQKPQYSIIVPVFNEAESLQELHGEICDVMQQLDASFEVLYVDDGSSDDSLDVLTELRDADRRVRVVSFVRNSGKSAAYMAAFERVRGQFVITMDADLQDDPAELPALLDELAKGYDLVVGWKQNRLGNEPHKALPSKFFNRFKSSLFGLHLHDSNCGFRVMKAAVAPALDLRGDLYRFIPELAHQAGFRISEAPVNHRKRKHGRSKYGPMRFWTGLLDLLTVRFITRYKQRPLHFFGTAALFPTTLGVALELYSLIMKFAFASSFRTHLTAIITGVTLILAGFQLLMTGLIGEMISAQRTEQEWSIDLSRSSSDEADLSRLDAEPSEQIHRKASAATGDEKPVLPSIKKVVQE